MVIRLHVRTAQLVGFITGPRGRRRPILRSSQRVTETQYRPRPRRRVPLEGAVPLQPCGEIDHLARRHDRVGGKFRPWHRAVFEKKTESRLLLPTIDPRAAMQHGFAQDIFFRWQGRRLAHRRGGSERRTGQLDAKKFRRDGGKRKRPHHALPVKLRAGQRHERPETHAVVAREHAADRNAVRAAAFAAKRDRARGERLRKLILDPRGATVRGRGHRQQRGQLVVEERRPIDRARVGRDLRRRTCGVALGSRRAVGDHGGVGVKGRRR